MKIIKVTQKNTLKVRVPAGFTGFTAGFWSVPVLVITQANCSFDWLRGHAKFMGYTGPVQMGYMARTFFTHKQRCALFGIPHIQISLTLRLFSVATFYFVFKNFCT